MGSGTGSRCQFQLQHTHKQRNPGARNFEAPVPPAAMAPTFASLQHLHTEMLEHLRSLPAQRLSEQRPSHSSHTLHDLSDVTLHTSSFASSPPGQVPPAPAPPQMLTELSSPSHLPSHLFPKHLSLGAQSNNSLKTPPSFLSWSPFSSPTCSKAITFWVHTS